MSHFLLEVCKVSDPMMKQKIKPKNTSYSLMDNVCRICQLRTGISGLVLNKVSKSVENLSF